MLTRQPDATKDEPDVRALIDTLVQAIRDKDIEGAMAVFAPEVVSFDLGPPLRHGGGEAFLRRWRALFDAYDGPIDYELRDLVIEAGDGVAFAHSLNRTAGTLRGRQRSERWLRWTACLARVEGRWRIVHEHVSVPVDLRAGKALLDLQP
jgi:uncharacterized protein (TIGR02246 family)